MGLWSAAGNVIASLYYSDTDSSEKNILVFFSAILLFIYLFIFVVLEFEFEVLLSRHSTTSIILNIILL
jgi:hypothetical protein